MACLGDGGWAVSPGAVVGLVSVLVGAAWWILSGVLLARRGSPEPFGRRWWGERGIYAVGFAFFFLGLAQLRDAMGWPGFVIGLAGVAVVMLVGLGVALVVKRRCARRGQVAKR